MTDNILVGLVGNAGDHSASLIFYDEDRFVNETGIVANCTE
jgi:hypothetical protein